MLLAWEPAVKVPFPNPREKRGLWGKHYPVFHFHRCWSAKRCLICFMLNAFMLRNETTWFTVSSSTQQLRNRSRKGRERLLFTRNGGDWEKSQNSKLVRSRPRLLTLIINIVRWNRETVKPWNRERRFANDKTASSNGLFVFHFCWWCLTFSWWVLLESLHGRQHRATEYRCIIVLRSGGMVWSSIFNLKWLPMVTNGDWIATNASRRV